MLWLTLGIIITQNCQSVTCELTAIGKESIIKTDFPRSFGGSENVVLLPRKVKS